MKQRQFMIGLAWNHAQPGRLEGMKVFTPLGLQFSWHDDGTWGVQFFLVVALLQFGWFDIG